MNVTKASTYFVELTEEEAQALRLADTMFRGNDSDASDVVDDVLTELDQLLEEAGCPYLTEEEFMQDEDLPINNDGDDDGA